MLSQDPGMRSIISVAHPSNWLMMAQFSEHIRVLVENYTQINQALLLHVNGHINADAAVSASLSNYAFVLCKCKEATPSHGSAQTRVQPLHMRSLPDVNETHASVSWPSVCDERTDTMTVRTRPSLPRWQNEEYDGPPSRLGLPQPRGGSSYRAWL